MSGIISDLDGLYAACETALANHRDDLLDGLYSAYERGPKARPFDRGHVWEQLNKACVVASLSRVVGPRDNPIIHVSNAGPVTASRAKLGAAARKLADQLRDVIATMDAMTPEFEAELMGAWSWLVSGGEPAVVEFTGEDRTVQQVNKAMLGLRCLGQVAVQVAEWHLQADGREPGYGKLPAHQIATLATLYQDVTGLRPTITPYGLFVEFVRRLAVALGVAYDDEDAELSEAAKAGKIGPSAVNHAVREGLKFWKQHLAV